MRFAFVNGERMEPQPGFGGMCPVCGSDMISKCGGYVRWHWAHKSRLDCDPWSEAETDWHLMWKDGFPSKYQEIVQIDESTGEKHIGDVKTPGGVIVEVQNSPISEDELRSREDFYGNMIWIVDARDVRWFTSFDLVMVEPMAYDLAYYGRSTLLKRWSSAQRPVYFDNTEFVYRRDTKSDLLWILPPDRRVPIAEKILWRMLEFDFDENTGLIAPVPAPWLVEAAMNGEPVPLARCDEQDAWQFRNQMIEFPPDSDIGGDAASTASDVRQQRPTSPPIDDDDLPF